MSPDTDNTEETLQQMFEDNFERLRAESGHTLSPEVKRAAWEQVLMYWRKLRHIAESVTDTEVKLNLPNQVTPKGRKFSIEGIVDIVREAGRTTMYDIKAHDLDFILANSEFYKAQLNVYAHVWQSLRGEELDESAVISTPLPKRIRQALERGDDAALLDAMAQWNPVVPIAFDADNVQETISKFAAAVDAIEDGEFSPPPTAELRRRATKKDSFGQWVCNNCDARFSCRSYRDYARAPRRKDAVSFMPFFDGTAPADASEARLGALIPATPRPAEEVADL